MAEIKVEYLAIMHMGDTLDNPSQIVRKTTCEDPIIFKTEGCNRITPWRESNHFIKYFWGMADEGYSMTEEEAEQKLSTLTEDLKKFQRKQALDMKSLFTYQGNDW